MCRPSSSSNQSARTAGHKIQPCMKRQALLGAQPVCSLGAPPLGARMQPDGMPSGKGMQRTHALCVVRSVDVVWVREPMEWPMLTGCVC